jgi:glycosyltransferase involved in cell wall biosynthesis
VHNVEADYQNFNRRGLGRLKYYYAKNCEKKVIQAASNLLVMHEFDARRLENIYQAKLDNYTIHPVCSFAPSYDTISIEQRDNIILFAGSFNNRFNEMGLLKFLSTCWAGIQDFGYTLLVAGRNPSQKLISVLDHYSNTKIIANPPDMEQILRKTRLIVLPDLYGTGMKLRVAQALSYGVPVVGTRLGLRGYDDVESFGIAVESIDSMREAVLEITANVEMLRQLSLNAVELWKRRYTLDVFRSRVHSILKKSL